jgi:hypothetical protein
MTRTSGATQCIGGWSGAAMVNTTFCFIAYLPVGLTPQTGTMCRRGRRGRR